MDIELFQLLMGGLTLAAVFVAAAATFRRHRQTSYYLVIAGLMGTAFFATVPRMPLATIGVSVLLTIVGLVLAHKTEDYDQLESSLTRRR